MSLTQIKIVIKSCLFHFSYSPLTSSLYFWKYCNQFWSERCLTSLGKCYAQEILLISEKKREYTEILTTHLGESFVFGTRHFLQK